MQKLCRVCNITLDENTQIIVKQKYVRSICRKCRSKKVVDYGKARKEHRREYANEYKRRKGIIKQYPCETCNVLCYKKYAKAFCSDKCRFMSAVQVSASCWMWKKGKNRRGYGKFSLSGNSNMTAHRASYLLFRGEIPEGKCVCHACDIPSCVRPSHLWLGTTQENTVDMLNKDRQRSRLSIVDVLKIRDLVNNFNVSQKVICEKFNITSGTVSSIISRRTWKHI